MVDIQQNRKLTEKKESKDRSGCSGQTATSLPHLRVYVGEDGARRFRLGLSQETYRRYQKSKGRGWVLPISGAWEPESPCIQHLCSAGVLLHSWDLNYGLFGHKIFFKNIHVSVCLYATCVWVSKEAKRVSDSLKLRLLMVMSH